MPLILELEQAYEAAKRDPAFTPNSRAGSRTMSAANPALLRGAADGAARRRKIYFKRDELNHTGAHKINNCSAR